MAEQKRDYYEVLGVRQRRREATLKKAYRQLAKKYHPDMNPGDKEAEKKFKEASEAYAILSDPEKRRQYDQFGHAAFEGGAGGAGGFGGSISPVRISVIFSAIFSVISLAAGRRAAPQWADEGENVRKACGSPSRRQFSAARRRSNVVLKDECPKLSRHRSKAGDLHRLPVQQVRRQRQDRLDAAVLLRDCAERTTCPDCHGTGQDHQGEVPGLPRHRIHREKEEDRRIHSRRHRQRPEYPHPGEG